MPYLQKIGGIAALVEAVTFVFGFWVYLAVVESAGYAGEDATPVQNAAFLADHQTIMYVWNLIIYVLFGAVLVVLALALHERLTAASPAIARVATAFGLIWAGLVIASGMVANIGTSAVVDLYETDPAQAGAAWTALDFVVNGLGGGNEIVGGLWVLLVSWAALRAGWAPRALHILGVVIGVSGLITAIPPLEVLGAVFGLGLIVWFIWLGIVLLRAVPSAAAPGSKMIPSSPAAGSALAPGPG